MFRKQVSRPVDGLEPAWWPARRSRSSELEEDLVTGPIRECPSGRESPKKLRAVMDRAVAALPGEDFPAVEYELELVG
jgi:hypothetical protein